MSGIEFGWRIFTFSPNGGHERLLINQIVKCLSAVEKRFDSVWIEDHFYPWSRLLDSSTTDNLECWTTLCYLAGKFKNLDFGTNVFCNSYRNPALLAKMGATLSVFTGGRFILGIGAGWKEDEYRAYGYNFPSASVRIRQLAEAVQIIRKMWTEKAPSFHGKYFHIESAYCNPRPDPPPPIMIGGGGKLTLKIVAKHADWWNYFGSAGTFKDKYKMLKSYCHKIGRSPDQIKCSWSLNVAIADSEAEAKQITNRTFFAKSLPKDKIVFGTPVSVAHQLKAFVKAGIEYFILQFLDFPSVKGTNLFANRVIPELH